jgi:Co/Zn/Cd efflux system component
MDRCCETKDRELVVLRQGWVLRVVLAVNLVMFIIEIAAGFFAGSTALLGDSLDMLGDSLVYGFTLYVIHRDAVWRARAVLAKGIAMLTMGCIVLVQAALHLLDGGVPAASSIAAIGVLALAANACCFALLWRHRSDDLNLRSTWLCSRNDLIANTAVVAAAALVVMTGSLWPDLVVGLGIALLFLRTAMGVLRESLGEMRLARGISAS